jgi:hypothetical protein
MSAPKLEPLANPPRGYGYYRSRAEIIANESIFAYQHAMLRAWEDLGLSAVLTLDGIPTVYVRDEKRPLASAETAEIHRQFWNQGVATVLLLRDPERVRVFSAMVAPIQPSAVTDAEIAARVVEAVDLATQASWQERFYLQLATGQYYSGDHAAKFNPAETVDSYLIDNLQAVRDELVQLGLEPAMAHAFLGRILFTCYLCDRGIIDLGTYFPHRGWQHLNDLLVETSEGSGAGALYDTLFPALQREFNSSLFDDDLDGERYSIGLQHLAVVRRFLNGDEVRKGQRSLGFWAYNFKFIPVETISAIYENFLEKEDSKGKRASGAFYTPRFLAEMTLDLALESVRPLRGKRYLDPACGSGIFLVLLFNRLVAEWRASLRRRPAPQEQAEALQELLGSLCGVDKNLTACRIACFSLYLAFLDQFDPPDVKSYKLATGKKLPNLLRRNDARRGPDLTVVWESNFFDVALRWKAQFDVVIGNPPWAGRGLNQIAQQFMDVAPSVLTASGQACLILPSKVFLNQTDAFQARWLRRVTLDKVVMLADYSFILFKKALCPCVLARFNAKAPDLERHEIEYVVPKVGRLDLRDGVIPVAPRDHKWIPLRSILSAADQRASGVAWKSRLWGTRRDLKLLDYLFTLPRLGELAGSVAEMERGEKRWCKGQGFQPLRAESKTDQPKPLKWSLKDHFVTPEAIDGLASLPARLTVGLGDYLKSQGYRLDKLHRPRDERIYEPPLVLLNQGFSSAAFFDYPVRFQHSLQSFSGPKHDKDALWFLTAFLRSKLARYFVFHTAANLGTERDKVHFPEVLRLPFFLPDQTKLINSAESIVARVAQKLRRVKGEMEESVATLLERLNGSKLGPLFGGHDENESVAIAKWLLRQQEKTRKAQLEIEPLIYEYFGLHDEEQALVEDTCNIFDRSDTPGSLEAAKHIPTLQPVTAASDLAPYADCLTTTLNRWASGPMRVAARGGVDPELGLAMVEVYLTKTKHAFERYALNGELLTALKRLQVASTDQDSSCLAYVRDAWVFEGPHLFIVKSALLGQWTRTAALNDAGDVHGEIAEARQQRKRA